jgi:LysR family transcriptional regulator, benzoate and cis,cis-muconate-responsive activator of ben and cat genes
MELRHLRYFQAVAEELSFSKAARRLRVAQPALSRAVKDLETQLGVELLTRSRRGVALTEAGAVLLDETAILMQRVDHLVGRVQRTAAGEEGEIRLGYIGAPTHAFLGRLLREFHQRFPRVSIILEERTPERVWEMVARGRLSLGLTRPVLAVPSTNLRTLLLRKEPLCGVFPNTDPRAKKKSVPWTDLRQDPLIVLARREGVGLHEEILAACRRARISPRLAHTPSVITTILSYVEAGAGIGVIPESVAMLGSGVPLTFRPLTPQQCVDLVMVWKEDDLSPPLLAFRTLVTEWRQAGKLWN